MRHRSQKVLRGIFVGITTNQKGYLVYVPIKRKMLSSHDILFDNSFSSALAYTSRPYLEAIDMPPAVSYITYATSYDEQTGNIITFSQFEEGGLVETERNSEEDE